MDANVGDIKNSSEVAISSAASGMSKDETTEKGEDGDNDSSSISLPEPSSVIFKVGSTILCQWGPNLFHAKVLKVETSPQESEVGLPPCAYFVHYNGWSKRFDAWVEQEFVYDDTPENRDIKKA